MTLMEQETHLNSLGRPWESLKDGFAARVTASLLKGLTPIAKWKSSPRPQSQSACQGNLFPARETTGDSAGIMAAIITIHIPMNEAAEASQLWPCILIQAIDMVQPAGMAIPPDMVALPQSRPPLHQPITILQVVLFAVQ